MTSERVCFVVLAHKNPSQVGRLCALLAPHPILLHVDARVNGETWQSFSKFPDRYPHVELLERQRSRWASWGLVQATLNGAERSLSLDCSHFVVMSGQDYLLRPVGEISSFLSEHPGASWISVDKMPVNWIEDSDGGLSRVEYWHLPIKGRRVRAPIRRQIPRGIVPCYGHANFILSAELVRRVVQLVERRPELTRFFRHTWIPDEIFFPSLVGSYFMDGILEGYLWFTDWSSGGSHPRVFQSGDLNRLMAAASGRADDLPGGPIKLFARKFDIDQDSEILELIDTQLLSLD
jgi:Core-2/I-Branching enzyme